MDRILDLLAAETEAFRNGEVPDYHLIQEIIDYCLDYPDACHHPKEDAIHRRLVARALTLPAAIADLAGAHRRLAMQTRRLNEYVERVMRDETMSRSRFVHAVEAFIDGHRAHMRVEEEYLFPEVLRLFDETDWAALQASAGDRLDPPARPAAETRFATLRKGILRTN